MDKLFAYYKEDAEVKAQEIAKEYNANVKSRSYDKVYDCTALDDKAEQILEDSVSGECGAYWIEDDDLDTIAVVAYWIEKENDL